MNGTEETLSPHFIALLLENELLVNIGGFSAQKIAPPLIFAWLFKNLLNENLFEHSIKLQTMHTDPPYR